MSVYTNVKLADEPIITTTPHPDFEVAMHLPDLIADLIALLEESGEPCTVIMEARDLSGPGGLDAMLRSATLIAREPGALFQHPLLHEFLLITDRKLFELVATGLRADAFGNVQVRVFRSMEDALDHARGGGGG